jgi:YidC/Oxa1 family membrane protein insertase
MNIFDILIVQPVFNLLIGLYSLIPGGDFGISLILFTVLVRFALYPLVKRQLHQTQAMKKLQPQLAKIKKETKGNKQLESMRMLELYKEHGVNPFRSIGILLIQLPIFIALYIVIQVFTSHRDEIAKWTYDFMEGLAPIKQLIEDPNSFNHMFLGFIDLTKSAFADGGVNIALILIALIAAATQYFMSKQTMPHNESKKRLRDVMSEAAQGKQADQSEMNAIVMGKMMKVLPIFMFFVMISVPGALALYYAMSNLVAVAQQAYLLRKDEEEMDALADKPVKKPVTPGKKATAKAREKAAKDAKVTKISAEDDTKKKAGKK